MREATQTQPLPAMLSAYTEPHLPPIILQNFEPFGETRAWLAEVAQLKYKLGGQRSGSPMSTIFQVFPTNPAIPSFRSLIQQAEPALAEFVEHRAGLRVAPRITLSLLEKETNRSLPLDLDAPALLRLLSWLLQSSGKFR